MKVNVGCGRHVLDGWMNVDIQKSPQATKEPQILSDLRKIPLDDNVASELMAIHVFEHFYLWECKDVLAEWRRILQPGGQLSLEMPDLIKCCSNIVNGVGYDGGGKNPLAQGMWGLYGDPRSEDLYMCHHWAWTYKTLAPLLQESGFDRIQEETTQWHPGGRKHRDMRVISFKSGN